MTALDGRVIEVADIEAATIPELIEAALHWAGQINVEPNTNSSVAKQAVCDLLLELKYRKLDGSA